MRDYEISSDLKQSKFENLKFVQGDTGSKIIVNLFEDSQTVNLTGCTVLAKYKRADGYTDNKEATITDNVITVEIDETMTAIVGTLKLIFEITYETTKKVSTFMLLADISEGIGSKSTTGGGTGDVVVDVDLSNYYNKQEIDKKLDNIANRTEILPIKNTHCVIQDGVPVSQQNININGIDTNVYTFNDEQITVPNDLVLENVKDKFSAICLHSNGLLNAIVTYNDGVNDITKEIELTSYDFYNSEPFTYDENYEFTISFGFDYDINKFYIFSAYWSEDMESPVYYAIKNVTISYNYYTNLIRDKYIQGIDYSKIDAIPSQLNYLADGMTKTLSIGEYANLFDNLFVWDANKINDQLDNTSGVKQNIYYDHSIQIKQKDSEGIGFGQYIPSSVMDEYKLFVSAGNDVIVKVYNRKRKALLCEIKDFTYGKYKEVTISDSYSGTDGIFIAFTVKDSVTSFNARTYVNDLILCKSDSFLTKQEVNEKVDKSQLSFNSNGELVVTIDGISKTFVPKS